MLTSVTYILSVLSVRSCP